MRVAPLPWVGNPKVLLNQQFDAILIAVDGEREAALYTIEALCSRKAVAVMAYSQAADEDMLIRCIRAGVREFMFYPFAPGVVRDAFDQVSIEPRRQSERHEANGAAFVFMGAKGGSGVTTSACNFAISLARETGRSTILIDLDLPLGDAGLNLGVAGDFSTLDALNDVERLDSTFLKQLTVRHDSGLFVLAGPGKSVPITVASDSVDRLLETARQAFDYVVVDGGSRWQLTDTRLFDAVSKIYLVTQVGIPELRNANRLLTGALLPFGSKVEVIVNRYTAVTFGIGEDAIEKALTRPAYWRIPNDYQAVRDMQMTAVPLMLKQSGIQTAIQKMARSACGLPPNDRRRRKFNLFGSRRGPDLNGETTQLGLSTGLAGDQIL